MLETARFADSYRDATEDRIEIIEHGPDTVVLVVADGVGGRPGGGAASEMAVRLVREAVPSSLKITDHMAWYRLLGQIDRALLAEEEAGETTLVAACVTPKRIVGASVGDSEAWFVTPEGHFDLTGGQQKKPYLGTGMARPVPFVLPTPRNGTIVVATDGLFKYAPSDSICDAALHPDLSEATRRLVNLVRINSGRLPDDVAVLLCRLSLSSSPTFSEWLRGILTRRTRR
jgi:serine/threonine protein phosphatase PrpC